jgi:hypothetical protein
MATGTEKTPEIDPQRLVNSLLTCAAYLSAIKTGMEQWPNVDVRVTRTEKPTLTMGPQIIDGGCVKSAPGTGTHLKSTEELITTEQYVADYLRFLANSLGGSLRTK